MNLVILSACVSKSACFCVWLKVFDYTQKWVLKCQKRHFFGYMGYIKTSTVFQSSWHGHRVWRCLTHHDATFSILTDVESRIKQVTKPCALSMPPFAWAVQRMLLAGSRVRTSCWIRWGWAYRFSDWIEMAIAWGDGYHANSFITSRKVDFSLVCYLTLWTPCFWRLPSSNFRWLWEKIQLQCLIMSSWSLIYFPCP